MRGLVMLHACDIPSHLNSTSPCLLTIHAAASQHLLCHRPTPCAMPSALAPYFNPGLLPCVIPELPQDPYTLAACRWCCTSALAWLRRQCPHGRCRCRSSRHALLVLSLLAQWPSKDETEGCS
jgi:hypothetical protein